MRPGSLALSGKYLVRLPDEDPWQRVSGCVRLAGGVMLYRRTPGRAPHGTAASREPLAAKRSPGRSTNWSVLRASNPSPPRPSGVSCGQRQGNLAAVLIGRPEVLFLDGSSAGFNPNRAKRLTDAQLRDAGTCIILTTHLMDDVARLADHVYTFTTARLLRRARPTRSAEQHAPAS